MASSALDFLLDEDELIAAVRGARFLHAGTPVRAPTPSPAGSPSRAARAQADPHPTPARPGLGSPVLGTSRLPPGTSTAPPTGTAAPVLRVQVAASSATDAAPLQSPSAPSAAAPERHAPVAASRATVTERTVNTRPVAAPPVVNAHSMRTRGKSGIIQPMDRLNLHVVPMSSLPRSVCDALSDPNWRSAM
jgi:hypothetical protein